jgi:hypothetical protein
VRRRACLEVVDLLLSQYPEAELVPLVPTKPTHAHGAEADAQPAELTRRLSKQRAQHISAGLLASAAAGHAAAAAQ